MMNSTNNNTSQAAHLFVSHSHEDTDWTRPFVQSLRQAGADVWYDEHDLGYGVLSEEIETELRARPIFIVVLSPTSATSRWVRREVDSAIRLSDHDPTRVIIPVVAVNTETPLFWASFRWISGPNNTGLSPEEAARRVVHTLALVPPEAPTAPPPPVLDETAEQAWERGKGLEAQHRYPEALAAYERATSLKPSRFVYWGSQAGILSRLGDFNGALDAYERATVLNPHDIESWNGKIFALKHLGRLVEAHAAEQERDAATRR